MNEQGDVEDQRKAERYAEEPGRDAPDRLPRCASEPFDLGAALASIGFRQTRIAAILRVFRINRQLQESGR